MYLSKSFMLLPLLLSFTVTDLVLAPQVAQAGVDGHQTFKCPRPAHWRLPDGNCIAKKTKKQDGINYYWSKNQNTRGNLHIPDIAACKASVATKKDGTHVKDRDRRNYIMCLLDKLEPLAALDEGSAFFAAPSTQLRNAVASNLTILTTCGIAGSIILNNFKSGATHSQTQVCGESYASDYGSLEEWLDKRQQSNRWLAYCEVRDAHRRDAMACLERALGGK